MNLEAMIVYTRREGDRLEAMWGNETLYEEIQERMTILEYQYDPPREFSINFVAYCPIRENFDKVLGRPR